MAAFFVGIDFHEEAGSLGYSSLVLGLPLDQLEEIGEPVRLRGVDMARQ